MKITKSQSDKSEFNSVRSPSSTGWTQMTHMTKVSGSQSSLKSAVSLKESPSFTTSKKEVPLDSKEKYSEREIDVRSDKSDITEKASVLSSTTTNASSTRKDLLSSSPVPRPRNPKHSKTSRTILDGGIPQTEV